MSETKKMTAEEFKELCKKAMPYLTALQEIVKENLGDEGASVSFGSGGYLSFRPYGTEWELNQYDVGGPASIHYEYRETLVLDDGEEAE